VGTRTVDEIEDHLAGLPEAKQADLRDLHDRILAAHPGARLWFHDGTNAEGKVVANPTIGYGERTIAYADGSTRESFRIGLTSTTSGISVHVLGLDDRTYLSRTYGASIGKATLTGYCIRFRRLGVIDVGVLMAAVRHGMTLD
jgi:hypothetical protein